MKTNPIIEEAQAMIATAFSPEMAYEAFENARPGLEHMPFAELPDDHQSAWMAVCRSFCDQSKGQFQHVATKFYEMGRKDGE